MHHCRLKSQRHRSFKPIKPFSHKHEKETTSGSVKRYTFFKSNQSRLDVQGCFILSRKLSSHLAFSK